MKKNIIIDIFNRSFRDHPLVIRNLTPAIINKMAEFKIDIQDLSLLETISVSELDEIIEKIRMDNQYLCQNEDLQNLKNPKIVDEFIENFFKEIHNSIDLVYNLIISKQLGG
jgi:hypothetical protein